MCLYLSFLVDLRCLCVSSERKREGPSAQPAPTAGLIPAEDCRGRRARHHSGVEAGLPGFDRYTIHCPRDPERDYAGHSPHPGESSQPLGETPAWALGIGALMASGLS